MSRSLYVILLQSLCVQAYRSNPLCGPPVSGCPSRSCDVDLDEDDVSDCYFECHSIKHIPDTCDISTTSISVKASCVESIEADRLSRYPSLTSLVISCNNLRSLPPWVFANNPRLIKIDLSHNFITSLDPQAFAGLENADLDLSNNELDKLPRGIFNDACRLRKLFLDKNNLTKLEPQWFGSNQSLRLLSLKENRIKIWPKISAFGGLERLYLNGNILDSWNQTEELTKLWELGLSKNQIKTIAKQAFIYNKKLKILDLSNNLLSSLESNLFEDLRFLQRLDISCNQLKVVQPEWFRHVITNIRRKLPKNPPSLSSCDDNKWQCDVTNCEAQEMLRKLDDDLMKDMELWWKYFNFKCFSPPELKGKNLFSVNISACLGPHTSQLQDERENSDPLLLIVVIVIILTITGAVVCWIWWRCCRRNNGKQGRPVSYSSTETDAEDPQNLQENSDEEDALPDGLWDARCDEECTYVNYAPEPPHERPPPLPPRDHDEEDDSSKARYFNVPHGVIP